MILNYKPETIEELNRDFLIATGVNFLLFDEDFKPLNYKKQSNNRYCSRIKETEEGRVLCRKSDRALLEKCKEERGAVTHICHAGLVDLAIPIVYEDKIIAYLILGQMKTENDFSKIKRDFSLPVGNVAEIEKLYGELAVFDKNRIDSIANVAIMMAKYILFENMLSPGYEPSLDRVLAFIDANLGKNMSISEISRATLMAKSSLYKLFHTHLGCTVSEYINSKRIEKAVELLSGSSMSVSEISEKLGFSSPQYFSRVFRDIKGVSPNQIRKRRSSE